MPAGFFNRLTQNSSNTDSSTMTLASVTPTNGRPLILFVTSLFSAAPTTPTATGTNGFSGTWTAIGSVTVGNRRLTMLRSVATSSVAGVVTIDWGGETQLARAAALHQGVNLSSAVPVQFKTASSSGGAALNFDADPLAAFAAPFNVTLGAFAYSATSAITLTNVSQLANGITASDGLQLTPFGAPLAITSPNTTIGSGDVLGIVAEFTQDGSDISAGGLTGSFEDAMIETRQADSVDQSVDIMMRSTTTGLPKTGLVYNTAGLTAHFSRAKSAAVDITLADLAAINSAHTDGGFKEYSATKAKGKIRLDLPDAVLASGVPRVRVDVVGTDCHGYIEIDLTADNPRAAAATTAEIAAAAVTEWMAEDNGGLTNAELLAAGGSFNVSAPDGVLTVKDADGTTLFARDLTRAVKNALTVIEP